MSVPEPLTRHRLTADQASHVLDVFEDLAHTHARTDPDRDLLLTATHVAASTGRALHGSTQDPLLAAWATTRAFLMPHPGPHRTVGGLVESLLLAALDADSPGTVHVSDPALCYARVPDRFLT